MPFRALIFFFLLSFLRAPISVLPRQGEIYQRLKSGGRGGGIAQFQTGGGGNLGQAPELEEGRCSSIL